VKRSEITRWRMVCLVSLGFFVGLGVAVYATGILPGDLLVRQFLLGSDGGMVRKLARWANYGGRVHVLLPAAVLLFVMSSVARCHWRVSERPHHRSDDLRRRADLYRESGTDQPEAAVDRRCTCDLLDARGRLGPHHAPCPLAIRCPGGLPPRHWLRGGRCLVGELASPGRAREPESRRLRDTAPGDADYFSVVNVVSTNVMLPSRVTAPMASVYFLPGTRKPSGTPKDVDEAGTSAVRLTFNSSCVIPTE